MTGLWEEQEGYCYYTGRKMTISGYHKGVREAVTVDRKNPNRGYVKGNVVLCCSFINRMKQDFTVVELLAYCKEFIAAQQGR